MFFCEFSLYKLTCLVPVVVYFQFHSFSRFVSLQPASFWGPPYQTSVSPEQCAAVGESADVLYSQILFSNYKRRLQETLHMCVCVCVRVHYRVGCGECPVVFVSACAADNSIKALPSSCYTRLPVKSPPSGHT